MKTKLIPSRNRSRREARIAIAIFGVSFFLLLAIETRADSSSKSQSKAESVVGECGGCAAVLDVEREVRSTYDKPEIEQVKALRKAARIVGEMPAEKGLWKPMQIQKITQLLRASTKVDKMNIIIDTNAQAFSKNQTALYKDFKRLPKDEAEKLKMELYVVMSEWKYGNDPEPIEGKAKIEKSAGSKSLPPPPPPPPYPSKN